jgi:hypothetical protein
MRPPPQGFAARRDLWRYLDLLVRLWRGTRALGRRAVRLLSADIEKGVVVLIVMVWWMYIWRRIDVRVFGRYDFDGPDEMNAGGRDPELLLVVCVTKKRRNPQRQT